MRKKKRSTVAKRLNRWIVLVVLILMTITVFFISLLTANVVTFGSTSVFGLFTKVTEERVMCELRGVEVAAQNNLAEMESSLDSPERLKRAMEKELRHNPHLKGCAVAFEPGFFPQKGRLTELHALRTDSVNIKVRDVSSANHDYLSEKWYKDAIAAEDGYWSDPYMDDTGTGLPFCSYSLPIHDGNGKVVGIYRAEISLEWLKARMIEITNNSIYGMVKYTEGELPYFIIGRDGRYLVHNNDSLIFKASYFDKLASQGTIGREIISEIKDGIAGHMELEGNLLASSIFYSPMSRVGWTMIMEPPKLATRLLGYVFAAIIAVFILLGLLPTIIVVRITVRRIMKPLKTLSASANEVAKGNFNTLLPPIKHNDEIGQLRDSFETMQHSLTNYVEELKTSTAQKAAMESELKIASEIQMSMVPKTFPPYPERHDINILASLTPAKAVGGDLYDFYIRDEKLFFCIGDVSGKGVPAALVMAVARTLFRNVSGYVERPDHILNAINTTMSASNEAYMFVTLFVGVLDLVSGKLSYSNAAHNPPLLIGKEVSMLPCDPNLPIGIERVWDFVLEETIVAPGTTIFLYTDGLTEAENSLQAQFGDQRMMEMAETLRVLGDYTPDSVIGRMKNAVHDFVGEAEQSDDLTMLAIQFRPETGEEVKELTNEP